MQEIQDIWNRIHEWLRLHAPPIAQNLQGGATETEIRELEQFLGVQLPADVRASYLICNGQKESEEVGNELLPTGEFLSLQGIKDEWQCWQEVMNNSGDDLASESAKGIRDVWWHPAWIPFTSNGSGDSDCIDLAPTEGGTVGQIIRMWHGDSYRDLLFPDFRSWLEAFATELENGDYFYAEDEAGLVPIEEISNYMDD